jgi:hypothetical protein
VRRHTGEQTEAVPKTGKGNLTFIK